MDKPIIRLERFAAHQKYFLANGEEVSGASSVAKMGVDPQGLIIWANREGLKGIDTNKVRDKAADIGMIGHFMVDCHLRKAEPDLREFEPWEIEEAEIVFDKALEFLASEKLITVAIEEQLVSETHKYGGTIDYLALDENGNFVLIDWKTSKKVYDAHLWQCAGYEMLWNENNPDKKVKRRAIILIGRDKKVTMKPRWISQEEAEQNMRIFECQAALFNAIKPWKKRY